MTSVYSLDLLKGLMRVLASNPGELPDALLHTIADTVENKDELFERLSALKNGATKQVYQTCTRKRVQVALKFSFLYVVVKFNILFVLD